MTGAPLPEPAETDNLRLDGASLDVADEKRRALLDLFPEARTEAGSIDFDQLRRALGDAVDPGKERFGLTWPGKAACFKAIQTPSMATLLPLPENSVDFETTGNVIIEGDNLEVLKLLQKSYLGKIKMIYIDPPYNTGNDFIYPDDYSESLQTYLRYTRQVDDDGKRFSNNTDADGRFHSKWLNMIYPRLYLARNLLREDGLLFVSCDDAELHSLLNILGELFGEENLVADLVWKKSYGGGSKARHAVIVHEYIVCFARNKEAIARIELPPAPGARKYYKYTDDKSEIRGPYRLQPLATTSNDERSNLRYPIHHEGEEVWPSKQWQWEESRVAEARRKDELVFSRTNGSWTVNYKQYLRDESGVERGAKPFSVLEGPYTQSGSAEVAELLGDSKVFPFPKPSALIEALLNYANPDRDYVVLDFFAGSGTTAHAVLNMNMNDGGQRKFILVQLQERTGRNDFSTISDIAEERVRRVAARLNDVALEKLPIDGARQDCGFRVFQLAESNVREWDISASHDPEKLQEQLKLGVDHLRSDRTDLDVVYEVLLKSGYTLSEPVTTEAVADHTVYSVAGGAYLICLERTLTLGLIRAIADRQPERVLFLDGGFAGNDQLKTNAAQTFKDKNIVFRTL